ncbi:TadE family protein [Nocardioides sp. TF02-7]|uniref:TadE family protein n=1 Tax=Nocardioides sp. TF02-7 TaxID=2917724 RepID=UPI001F06F39E|nr:TadE family protein [Nocardioides sp. TF02-7]UMG93298.1 pilus assembly protein [Nocardioides sp. TF02-7]
MTRLRARRRDDESGASSVELVLFMPLLVFIIFLVVQFALVWFGNQAANSVARETARIARIHQDQGLALQAGQRLADQVGPGVLEDVDIDIQITGDTVRVTVTGRAQELSPIGVPRVRETVEGPIEEFEE